MSSTIEMPVLDLDELDEMFEARPGPTAETWLETMWGITPGKSSPVCQGVTYGFPPALAGWYRICGLVPRSNEG
jgi:hypothetical protein